MSFFKKCLERNFLLECYSAGDGCRGCPPGPSPDVQPSQSSCRCCSRVRSGHSLARLTRSLSTKNICKDAALFCGGTVAFFIFLSLVLSIDPNASGEVGEKYGRLAGVGLFIILAAYSWLDKGLELVKQGIKATSENASATPLPSKSLTSLHYVSLFFGLTVLVLWLG